MRTYHKIFTVRNTLITYEVWDRHQTDGWKNRFGTSTPPAIFDVTGGVADAYYHGVFQTFRAVMTQEYKKDPRFFTKMMDQYEAQLDSIQSTIAHNQPFPDVATIETFAQQFQDTWIGLDLSYMPVFVGLDTAAERRSSAAREKAFGFYIGADHLIRTSLEKMFPEINMFVGYITLEELKTKKIPKKAELEARAKHFIYYEGKVITNLSFEDFCRRESIRIASMYASLREKIPGLIAAGGTAKGSAFILTTNADRKIFKTGDVLVAHDLAQNNLDLIERASAIVLDTGSYYGSAAIAARTMKKPCIFETRLATMVLQQGDMLEVDGEKGTVRLANAENK